MILPEATVQRLLVVGLVALAVILLVTALQGPWWTYALNARIEILGVTTETDLQTDYSLSGITVQGTIGGNDFSDSTSYDETGNEALRVVFANTALFTTTSLILAVLVLLAWFLGGLRIVPPPVAVALALIAALAILGTAVYFWIALPPAVEASFAGLPGGVEGLTPTGFTGQESRSLPGTVIQASWGPAPAWILVGIGFLVMVAVAAAVRSPSQR